MKPSDPGHRTDPEHAPTYELLDGFTDPALSGYVERLAEMTGATGGALTEALAARLLELEYEVLDLQREVRALRSRRTPNREAGMAHRILSVDALRSEGAAIAAQTKRMRDEAVALARQNERVRHRVALDLDRLFAPDSN